MTGQGGEPLVGDAGIAKPETVEPRQPGEVLQASIRVLPTFELHHLECRDSADRGHAIVGGVIAATRAKNSSGRAASASRPDSKSMFSKMRLFNFVSCATYAIPWSVTGASYKARSVSVPIRPISASAVSVIGQFLICSERQGQFREPGDADVRDAGRPRS